jgi:hypothetical protein
VIIMTDTASTDSTFDLADLSSAIERRDAESILTWYAEDATLTILDRDHPPAAPASYHGLAAIGDYYREICGRNLNHRVSDAVSTPAGLAYRQQCRYPDGAGVVCVSVAAVRDGKIQSQTAVQVWDS